MKRIISRRDWMMSLVKRAQEEEVKIGVQEATEIFSSYFQGTLSDNFFEEVSETEIQALLLRAWKRLENSFRNLYSSNGKSEEAFLGILTWGLGEGGKFYPEEGTKISQLLSDEILKMGESGFERLFEGGNRSLIKVLGKSAPALLESIFQNLFPKLKLDSSPGLDLFYRICWNFQSYPWAVELLLPQVQLLVERVKTEEKIKRSFSQLSLFSYPSSAFLSAFGDSELGVAWQALAEEVKAEASSASSPQPSSDKEARREEFFRTLLKEVCSSGQYYPPVLLENSTYKRNKSFPSFISAICKFFLQTWEGGEVDEDCRKNISKEFFGIIKRKELDFSRSLEFRPLVLGIFSDPSPYLADSCIEAKKSFLQEHLPPEKFEMIKEPYTTYRSPDRLNDNSKLIFDLMKLADSSSEGSSLAEEIFIKFFSKKLSEYSGKQAIVKITEIPDIGIARQTLIKSLLSAISDHPDKFVEIVNRLNEVYLGDGYTSTVGKEQARAREVLGDMNEVFNLLDEAINPDSLLNGNKIINDKYWSEFFDISKLLSRMDRMSWNNNNLYLKLKNFTQKELDKILNLLNTSPGFYKEFLLNFPHNHYWDEAKKAFGDKLDQFSDTLYAVTQKDKLFFFLFYRTKFFKDEFSIPENFKDSPAVLEKFDNYLPLKDRDGIKPSVQEIYSQLENDDDSPKIPGVTVKVSGYQTLQREPELKDEIRYEVSNDNIRPSYPLYLMGKVYQHAGDGILHTNLGAAGFSNSWCLTSYTDDKIVVEQIQSDYGSTLQQVIYLYTKKNVGTENTSDQKKTVLDAYGSGFEINISQTLELKNLRKFDDGKSVRFGLWEKDGDKDKKPPTPEEIDLFSFKDIRYNIVKITPVNDDQDGTRKEYLKKLFAKEQKRFKESGMKSDIFSPKILEDGSFQLIYFFVKIDKFGSIEDNSLTRQILNEEGLSKIKKMSDIDINSMSQKVEDRFSKLFRGIRNQTEMAQYLKNIVKSNGLYSENIWLAVSNPSKRAMESSLRNVDLRKISEGGKNPMADDLDDAVKHMQIIDENYPYLNLRNICKMAIDRGDEVFYILKAGGRNISNKKKAKLLYETIPSILEAEEDEFRGMPVWKVPATEETISKLTSLITIPIDLPGEVNLNTYNFSLTPKQNLEAGNIKLKTTKFVSSDDVGRIKQLIVDSLSQYNLTGEIKNIISSFGEKLDSPALNTSLSNLMIELVKSRTMTKDQANGLIQPIRREIAQIAKEANFIEKKLVKLSHLLTKFKVKDKNLNSLLRYYFN